jgi:hypothetical protein
LNRLGKTTFAGILLVAGFELGYLSSFLTMHSGPSIADLPRYALLVEPLLLAVSFLPAGSVFLVALVNILFTCIDILFLPHSAGLAKLLSMSAYGVIEIPVGLQLVVALVSYLWVRSFHRAIERAEQAEEIAHLQQNIARQKQELDKGIQIILQTHVQVANGDFNARAPLTRENVLWKISISLNNLLTRFQRLSQAEYELHRTQNALQQAHREIARLNASLRASHPVTPDSDKFPQFHESDETAPRHMHMPKKIAPDTQKMRSQKPFPTWTMDTDTPPELPHL